MTFRNVQEASKGVMVEWPDTEQGVRVLLAAHGAPAAAGGGGRACDRGTVAIPSPRPPPRRRIVEGRSLFRIHPRW